VDGLTEAIGAAATCSPYACRARVEAHFSASEMVANYEHLFADVVGSAAVTESVSEFPLRR
jgi:hypothetical protein